jgi:hypothetical protein
MQDYRNLQVWEKRINWPWERTHFLRTCKSLMVGRCATSYSGRRYRSHQISPKAPAEAQIPISEDSCGIPWVPVMNLSMICFLPEISGSCRWSCTGRSPDRWKKSDGCYRVWYNN